MIALRPNNAEETPWLLATREGCIPGLSNHTALHEACLYGQTATVHFLVEVLRCDVFAFSKERLTPISKAVIHSHLETFQELLNFNADPLQDGQTLTLGLKYGTEKFIGMLFSFPFIASILDSNDWLEPLAANVSGVKFLKILLHSCIPADMSIDTRRSVTVDDYCTTRQSSRI
jgi:ankyrin repeat protein